MRGVISYWSLKRRRDLSVRERRANVAEIMKHRSLTSGEVRINILQIDFEGTGLDHYVSISFRVIYSTSTCDVPISTGQASY